MQFVSSPPLSVSDFSSGMSSYNQVVGDVTDWVNDTFGRQVSTPTSDAAYTPVGLSVYDALVWGFNSPFHWRIREEEVQQMYQDCLSQSKDHAEVAVGTGLFLRDLDLDGLPLQHVSLLDLNPNALDKCVSRIQEVDRYKHAISIDKIECDILQPVQPKLRQAFDSVAANFLLHCLHGDSILKKRAAFESCASLLKGGGVFFGTTILGQDIQKDASNAGDATMRTQKLYNELGIFGNEGDTFNDVSMVLHELFEEVQVWRVGYCAAWKARKPRPM